jgi:hypothetical protein
MKYRLAFDVGFLKTRHEKKKIIKLNIVKFVQTTNRQNATGH